MFSFLIRLIFAIYGASVGKEKGYVAMFACSLVGAFIGDIFAVGLMEVFGC